MPMIARLILATVRMLIITVPGLTVLTSSFNSSRYAVYGQLDWVLNEQWLLSLGGRSERFENDYSDSFWCCWWFRGRPGWAVRSACNTWSMTI